ncbi:unnamed protein product [Rodentolepis nana]|uniref:Death domain-containing protein n=1 Tax=Rodentolepis nana TaxID=102285 RepID=A0A158QJ70_RODNA|nr:unnamed protein product [Rodentolepis nana]
MGETSKVLAGPGDHLDAEWEMETEPTLSAAKKPHSGGPLALILANVFFPPSFLVSFLVDARGGLLESKRYPGLRFIIPPNASIGPLRIICRLLRYPSYAVQPPFNDGEGLACRLIEVGPVGVHFNSPILIEVPYCASVRNNQREIIVLRSENGEIWKEHPVDPTDQAVQDSLGPYFCRLHHLSPMKALWLIDCPNLSEVSEMATRVYREAIAVPYLGRFVVYGRRHHPEESHVRCVCLTDDTEQKTLECQEGFEVIARSGGGGSGDVVDDSGLVEFLHNRSIWVETAGNLVPVAGITSPTSLPLEENGAPSAADQPRFTAVRAFEENRLNTILRIKDINSPPTGQLAFMPQRRQPGGGTVNPLCVLDVTLPRMAPSMIQESNENRLKDSVANFFNAIPQENDCGSIGHRYAKCRLIDSIARSELDLKKVAENLGRDWSRVAPFLGLSVEDISSIRESGAGSDYKMALTCLTLWQERNGSTATGTALAQALKSADQDNVIRQSMQNVSLVQQDPELSYALRSLETPDVALTTTSTAVKEDPIEESMALKPAATEPVAVPMDHEVVEETISPIEISHQPLPTFESATDAETEENKEALEALIEQLEAGNANDLPPLSDVLPTDVAVEEEELVPVVAHRGIELESAVPAFILEELEREGTGTNTSSPSHRIEPLDVDDIATAGDGIFSMTYNLEESRPRPVSMVKEQRLEKSAVSTSDVDIMIASTQQQQQQQQKEMEKSDRNSPIFCPKQQRNSSTVAMENLIIPEVYNRRSISVHSKPEDGERSANSSIVDDECIIHPVVQPLCGWNEATWGKPQSPRHSPKEQRSMLLEAKNNDVVDESIIIPTSYPLCGWNEATWGKPQSPRHSPRQSVVTENFDDNDFVITPVAYPMCGVNEATWGRPQSPRQSTLETDAPEIASRAVERLREREKTGDKPKELHK